MEIKERNYLGLPFKYAGFEVLAAVVIKTSVFLVITPCTSFKVK
jgi:hypothetical protein